MPILPNKSIVARNTDLTRATRPVTYLTPEEVRQIENAALESPRKGERDALLVRVLFQTGLRISEALSLTPTHLEIFGRPAGLPNRGQRKQTPKSSLSYNLG